MTDSGDSPERSSINRDDAARDAIGSLLGRVPSGVFVLSIGDGEGRETAMLASWVQQASFAPPLVSVAINRDRWFCGWVVAGAPAALSIVASGQKEWLKRFGKGFGPEEPAFEGVEVTRGARGVSRLSDCLGALEGRIVSVHDAGDHRLALVEIESAVAGRQSADVPPMVHLRKNGFRY